MIGSVAWRPYKPTKKHKTWWVRGADHRGVRRRLSAFRSKQASETYARNVSRLVEITASGSQVPEDLAEWVNARLDEGTKDKLVDWGILSRRFLLVGMELDQHLAEYESYLKTQKLVDHHIATKLNRARLVLARCNARTYAAITPEGVAASVEAVGTERDWSASTRRHALSACKEFCNWMHTFSRANHNPLRVLPLTRVREADLRRKRRALTFGEQQMLVEGVRELPARGGMVGPVRALFYRVALETGYRREAMMDLTVADVKLLQVRPMIMAPTGGRKKRVAAELTAETAGLLREYLQTVKKLPGAPLWGGEVTIDALRHAIDADCGDLGIPKFSMHDLRHTFVTNLARAGVHPKTAQKMAGHADISTTMAYYTHMDEQSPAEALRQVRLSKAASQSQPGSATEGHGA